MIDEINDVAIMKHKLDKITDGISFMESFVNVLAMAITENPNPILMEETKELTT